MRCVDKGVKFNKRMHHQGQEQRQELQPQAPCPHGPQEAARRRGLQREGQKRRNHRDARLPGRAPGDGDGRRGGVRQEDAHDSAQ